MRYNKVYVSIIARIDTDGGIKPLFLEWKDGRRFEVTKVCDIRFAPPDHVGGTLTIRYDCIIDNQMKALFQEEHTHRWFVEARA